MIPFPQIDMRQQFGRIGIDADLGHYEIHQSKATLDIQTTPSRYEVSSPQGELHINQDRAWSALNGGKPAEFTNRIYSQMDGILLQAIAKIVQDGNRMAALNVPGNPLADIAFENAFEPQPSIEYMGEASYDNVDIEYIPHKPDIQFVEGKLNIQSQVNKPEINYVRGKLDIYMEQSPKLDIIPPVIDTRL
ncbi:hypothetical protein GCM10023310_61890 [Paenibacillus vulneris]|uniref:DUF6470 family protein n=1 Tax=Paenibacillus vulneris TaxID=1133364 RepID=A0ABW3UDI1_9BACL